MVMRHRKCSWHRTSYYQSWLRFRLITPSGVELIAVLDVMKVTVLECQGMAFSSVENIPRMPQLISNVLHNKSRARFSTPPNLVLTRKSTRREKRATISTLNILQLITCKGVIYLMDSFLRVYRKFSFTRFGPVPKSSRLVIAVSWLPEHQLNIRTKYVRFENPIRYHANHLRTVKP